VKKSGNLPSNFPDLQKDWKMELMSGKMVKSLDIFFKATASASLVELFFVLANLLQCRLYVCGTS